MFKIAIRKLISLYVKIRFKNIPKAYFYYYRDTYICRLNQLKYFIKDHITKPKYKEISFNGEFAAELQFVLPFAYWHYKNGTLKSTTSSKLTREFYFFSPDHSEDFETRSNEGNYDFELPRILYSHDYNMSKWEPVPFKEIYANEIYKFARPILIIANRYNMEWDGPPISFYDMDTLEFIIEALKDKYTIIYNRPRPENITLDGSEVYDMDEYQWLGKKYPKVILMDSLFNENKGNAKNFNHLQMMVYANASKFISIHGGTATLASYFGGTNLILSKQGPEHYFKCFEKLYPKFSKAKVLHAKTSEEVKTFVTEYF